MDVNAALLRTADWLEAHPDRHITTVLATAANGNEVWPFAPEAHCFCAYGRFLVELGDEGQRLYEDANGYGAVFDATGIRYETVYNINDRMPEGGDGEHGNPEVIDYLRQKAK